MTPLRGTLSAPLLCYPYPTSHSGIRSQSLSLLELRKTLRRPAGHIGLRTSVLLTAGNRDGSHSKILAFGPHHWPGPFLVVAPDIPRLYTEDYNCEVRE